MENAIASHKTPLRVWLIAALAAAGMAVSVALTQHYYSLRAGTLGFKSFCNINQSMNCDQVAASSYATLPLGIPLSSLSGGWYLGIFLIALVASNAFWRRETYRALLAMSAVGVLTSLIYFIIMASFIKTYCMLCLGVDVINLGLFGVALSLKPEGFSRHKPELRKWRMLGVLALASVLVTMIGLKSLDAAQPMDGLDAKLMVQKILESPPVSVDAGDEFPSLGSKDAPITIVEFSDYQCPFCRLAAFTLNSVQMRFPDKVRIVFRGFPLDQKCNPHLDHPVHEYACEAARTALCSFKQGKFEKVYESLFENQENLGSGKPEELALAAEVDPGALKSCMESQDINNFLARDIEAANNLGVKSTPTLFVNGHMVEGAIPESIWETVIQSLLSQK